MFDGIVRVAAWTQRYCYTSLEKVLTKPAEYWSKILSDSGVTNYVIVSTCNRFEIYYSADGQLSGLYEGSNALNLSGPDAIDHLFRVTAGLDSMSVGENEILHQVKESFDAALRNNHVSGNLALLFRRALSSGKLIRRDTRISRGKVSITALSIDIMQRKYGISGRKVAVVGTGKMANDILKYLVKLNPEYITVVGRSEERAMGIAESFDASSAGISELGSVISQHDMVITATSSKSVIINRSDIEKSDGARIYLDISNPRNIEAPQDGDSYSLVDLASLKPILESNRENKQHEIILAEEIVREQIGMMIAKFSRNEVESVIGNLYKHAEEVRKHEISRLTKALASGMDFDRAIDAMTSALVKKLLATQTEVLRNVHGERVSEDILDAVKRAYFSENEAKNAAMEPQDRRGSRNRRGQIPP